MAGENVKKVVKKLIAQDRLSEALKKLKEQGWEVTALESRLTRYQEQKRARTHPPDYYERIHAQLVQDMLETVKVFQQKVSQENILEIRKGLTETYENRLKSKLAYRYPINLELKYSLEGTTLKAPLFDNKTIRSSKIKEELISLFDKHRGRLLIIGEPGAGKTTLLIQLALKLLEREEPQIPIIINMATWRERFTSVKDWLTELLPQMGFSKGLTKQILLENRLLPLFDGLDELFEDNRQACLDAIGEYGKAQNANYVICSRIEEYARTVDAPVYCQIMVKPLTLKQIKEGLEAVNSPETRGLLHAIQKDKLFAEAIKTPFYLNTMLHMRARRAPR